MSTGSLRIRISPGYTKSGGWHPRDLSVEIEWADKADADYDELAKHTHAAIDTLQHVCTDQNLIDQGQQPRPSSNNPFSSVKPP